MHGARVGPRSGIREELMDSLVRMVAEGTNGRERAFGVSCQPHSGAGGRAMWKA
ncbi:MAG TPA: hypothetical protein VOB72_26240 [Candidatus Dormibacteraeota bacterium]|nr:hypothetical protein [Candidatus Dormibacteraeota bacterium]